MSVKVSHLSFFNCLIITLTSFMDMSEFIHLAKCSYTSVILTRACKRYKNPHASSPCRVQVYFGAVRHLFVVALSHRFDHILSPQTFYKNTCKNTHRKPTQKYSRKCDKHDCIAGLSFFLYIFNLSQLSTFPELCLKQGIKSGLTINEQKGAFNKVLKYCQSIFIKQKSVHFYISFSQFVPL